jgi:hypothetical protein
MNAIQTLPEKKGSKQDIANAIKKNYGLQDNNFIG